MRWMTGLPYEMVRPFQFLASLVSKPFITLIKYTEAVKPSRSLLSDTNVAGGLCADGEGFVNGPAKKGVTQEVGD